MCKKKVYPNLVYILKQVVEFLLLLSASHRTILGYFYRMKVFLNLILNIFKSIKSNDKAKVLLLVPFSYDTLKIRNTRRGGC